ncbi:hypothetical protein NUU61_009284 [Penicillium alfredii]|uniref:Calcineurin-like phosphoesterase domain-containing protein n=1 Tax=Penicillium alfredii TaxID=1506179 RepID=A0A9W9JX46_9EURO|nr:uncharacterized protein NUU61_009284 [Penicillium alfredii]KAJ5084705.1 hypothetical protein NUU61_009284 [Penicillium alfredii]
MTGIKTRVCMISDTHTCAPNPRQYTWNAYRHPLPTANILLHAGDLTKVGYRVEHEAMIAMLKKADAELKLVIAGNHDVTLDEDYFMRGGYRRHRHPELLGLGDVLTEEKDAIYTPQSKASDPGSRPEDVRAYVQRAQDLYTNDEARAAGIRYLEEGVHSFTLSTGATFTVYASPYQPEFCNWAFSYKRNEDRFNPPESSSSSTTTTPPPQNPVPDHPAIDFLLTHGPPEGVLDRVGPGMHVGCVHLLRAAGRSRPRIHVFGHIHEGWGALRGIWDAEAERGVKLEPVPTDPEEMMENRGAFYDMSSQGEQQLQFGAETLFVNASINTVAYQPRNAPWVVDLELPRAAE